MTYTLYGALCLVCIVVGWLANRLWMYGEVHDIARERAQLNATIEFVQGRLGYFTRLEELGRGLLMSLNARGVISRIDTDVKRFAKVLGYELQGEKLVDVSKKATKGEAAPALSHGSVKKTQRRKANKAERLRKAEGRRQRKA